MSLVIRLGGVFFVAAAAVSACSADRDAQDHADRTSQAVVFGADDRVEPGAFRDAAFAAFAQEVTVALVPNARIDRADPAAPRLVATSLHERRIFAKSPLPSATICRDVAFADQPTAAGCSGTLIAPDLVLTAGHCIGADECASTSLVFDYRMPLAGQREVPAASIYGCQSVLVDLDEGLARDALDFAIVKLDRPATGRRVAPVVRGNVSVRRGAPLLISGFPSGLPHKIAGGASVHDTGAPGLKAFHARIDGFGGNSGSGVYVDERGPIKPLAGIYVRSSNEDYAYDREALCYRPTRCSPTVLPDDPDSTGCGRDDSVYAARAIDALCADAARAAAYPALCACGSGACDHGESAATCPADCPTSCGDGVCGGGETATSCPADCATTCGDGHCSAAEQAGGCCADCGCAAGSSCARDGKCVARIAPQQGDTCADALPIAPTGAHSLRGHVAAASDDTMGAPPCLLSGKDAVYTFRVRTTTELAARVSRGFGLALFQSECTWPRGARACGRASASVLRETLEPGVYFLVVDATGGSFFRPDDYTLDVAFGGGGLEGETCATARPVDLASGAAQVHGTTAGARNDLRPRSPADPMAKLLGPDLVYEVTLTAPTKLVAIARGFPHIAVGVAAAPQCAFAEDTDVAADAAGRGAAAWAGRLGAGKHYVLVSGLLPEDAGAFTLDLARVAPTAGETCDTGIPLTPTGARTLAVDTTTFTDDARPPTTCGVVVTDGHPFGHGPDAFYRFTLAEPTRVEAAVTAPFPTLLRLERGTCAAPAQLACHAGGARPVRRVLPAGDYTLSVDGQGPGHRGAMALDVAFAPPGAPRGEGCLDAIPLAPQGAQRVAVDLRSADDAVALCNAGADRTYGFTLSQRTRVTAAVLPPTAGSVTLTDAACAHVAQCTYELATTLEPGEHRLVVKGRGAFDVDLTFGDAPTGQRCSDAIPLATGPTATVRGTIPASSRMPPPCGGGSGVGVGYGVVLASSTMANLSATWVSGPSTPPPAIGIYADCAASFPTSLACGSDVHAALPAGAYTVVVSDPGEGPPRAFDLTTSFVPHAGDADGDGALDSVDGCPLDAAKVAPGACGCGKADTDPDGDGAANCVDACPRDFAKTAPGVCGCGVADVDADGDGAPACKDACPSDPAKLTPGACGCGVADADGDGDGTPDCLDDCPADAKKVRAGFCGCARSDADRDVDETPDCSDGCPDDEHKTAAGTCGCGVVDAPGCGIVTTPDAGAPADGGLRVDASADGGLQVDASAPPPPPPTSPPIAQPTDPPAPPAPAPAAPSSAGGCSGGCSAAPTPTGGAPWLAVAALAILRARRRARAT